MEILTLVGVFLAVGAVYIARNQVALHRQNETVLAELRQFRSELPIFLAQRDEYTMGLLGEMLRERHGTLLRAIESAVTEWNR